MQSQQRDSPIRRRFGPFEYDPAAGELRRFGNRVKLQGQPLQILELLLERSGEVVTREELQRRLWNGTSFVDSEHGLNAAVNKLRQALGDSADQPRFVETLPGRGYRFVGPMAPEPGGAVPIAAPRVPEGGEHRRRWPAAWWAFAACALAGIGYWAGARTNQRPPPTKPLRFSVTPPPGFHLEQGAARASFALSPDGSKLAFTAMDAAGANRVFIRDLAEIEARELPGSKLAHSLFWGSGGRSLYVLIHGKLRRFSLETNESVVIGEVPPFTTSGAELGPDRVIASSIWKTALLRSPGSAPELLPELHAWPQLLPGGRMLSSVTEGRLASFRARITSLGDLTRPGPELFESESRTVYAETSRGGYLIHLRAGSLVARPFDLERGRLTGETLVIAGPVSSFAGVGAGDFSASLGGTVAYMRFVARSRLVWVDRSGRQVGTIGPDGVGVLSGRLSPDGSAVAAAIYDVEKGAQDLWLFDVATGAGRRLTPVAGLRDAPVWAPDSRRLAYLRRWNQPPQVFFRGLQDRDGETALRAEGFQAPTNWSRDGRFVLFHSTGFPQVASEQQSDVWIADPDKPDAPPMPLVNTAFHEANAAFSPDGKWVAFLSNESGHPEIYLQAFDVSARKPRLSGKRHLASHAGAMAIRWRRDGRELFYLAPDGRVYAVPVVLGVEPSFGPPVALFTIPAEARSANHSIVGFDVTADGARFLVPAVAADKPGPSITIAREWDAK